ncbi:unnamed protein product [Calicophoron daubneyi]|uniref:Glutaredoxin domain-containing protein n=1 Tax=Calicophoron daubneyi TaxID=300641 RepID=A0AAV2T3J5_CALDB
MPEVTCPSAEALRSLMSDKKASLILNFTAPWSPQCAQVTEVVKTLASESENADIQFVTNGCETSRISGANIAEITKAVKALRSSAQQSSGDKVIHKYANIEDRLHALINQAPIMLFMKGSPKEPRCGFSRKMVEILQSAGAKFDHFDILQDEEVRQGLKTFSNWPTYPQLYVKGELIGGVDIVKELADSGELAKTLQI